MIDNRDSILPNKMMEPEKETDTQQKGINRKYMLMMWDGLGFFGTSDTKLPRLKGKKVTWCTPF